MVTFRNVQDEFKHFDFLLPKMDGSPKACMHSCNNTCNVCTMAFQIPESPVTPPTLHKLLLQLNKQPQRMSDHPPPTYDRRRSRSPRRRDASRLDTYRARSPQPHRHHHRRKHNNADNIAPAVLPYNSRELTKRDYAAFRPMFALYLDIQKGKVLDELDEQEVRGRWKSFLGKW
jgi:hypothetical protein